ncbi:metallophosphoesterase family protein [Sphingobacterium yanglingense]|uniref:Calcineurin-like phosphoesterase family protein n=1 Tax=Sphingobacterium yanglingense TaxID=1437280 RepID=A0A4R6WT09_9SPHI|nr:metallophosphoesterase [Sphingobacterium yanglingense]TDQ82899.1 calcineurin-like phosphoesterase family protein [Sphingobacterium yanglingense]
MYLRRHFFLPLAMSVMVSLISCNRNFQFSVLEVKPLDRDINLKAIARIKQLIPHDTFSFLIFSDTQVAYDELESFVAHVNSTYTMDSIAFLVHGGDFTDYGANFEYNLYYDDVRKLKFPVVGCIGNHDMLSNGRTIFKKLFGPENFSFNYGDYRFIVFNSNSREVRFDGSLPNLSWLQQEINSSAENNTIYLSHVAPMTTDFDPALKNDFTKILASNKKSRLSIHGHTHNYVLEEPYTDGVQYLTVPTLQKRQYVKVTISPKDMQIQQKFY